MLTRRSMRILYLKIYFVSQMFSNGITFEKFIFLTLNFIFLKR